MKHHRNTLMIQAVAEGLGELAEKVAFVGGATTALYIDDPGAPTPTPSDDVDFLVEIATMSEYAKLEAQLREKGFKDPQPDSDAKPPICRKIYKDINVDVMPMDEKVLGFSNRWYREAIKHREAVTLPNGTKTYKLNVTYFLATKFEAFNSRGKDGDIRFSHDLEDIVAVLDGCSYVEREFHAASGGVQEYLKNQFASLLKEEDLLEEAANGFIRNEHDTSIRAKRIIQKIKTLAKGSK